MRPLTEEIVALGAHRAAELAVADIPFDRSFRALCESNACGNYGKCWMCPPDAGDIDALMAEAKTFRRAVVYQTVSALEDSYDFEGMMAAAARHNELARRVSALAGQAGGECLHLGAGGCHVCEVCAKRTEEQCRYPDRAMPSLETYGIAVSELAARCGLKYINGPDTVTYFGALLLREGD